MKHACLENNIIKEIHTVQSSEEISELMQRFPVVLLIEDLILQPQVGWVFNGTHFDPPQGQQVPIQQLIESKIKYFQSQSNKLLVDLYVLNTLQGITTQQSDEMFDQYSDVLIRLREGAWPTALARLMQKEPSGFVTQELLDSWKAKIIEIMAEA